MKAICRFAIVALSSGLVSSVAQAQLFRAYIASYGNDSNPCTVSAPCRLLPAGIAAVVAGGEVWILDSANFNTGTVNIAKNVDVMAVPGQVGSFVSSGGAAAITVASNTKLKLKNIAIVNNGNSPGTDGVVAASGSKLSIEHSKIGVVGTGVDVTDGNAYIGHTSFHGSTNGVVGHGAAKVDMVLDKFINISQYAVYSDGSVGGSTARLFVSESAFFGDNAALVAIANVANADARITAAYCSINGGQYGAWGQLNAAGTATVTVGYSMLAGLNVAFHNVGGAAVESQGNNLVRNNGIDTDAALTSAGSM